MFVSKGNENTPLMENRKSKADVALQNSRVAMGVAIVALILGGGVALGYGLWIGLADNTIEKALLAQSKSLGQLNTKLAMTQAELLEIVQNSSGIEVIETVVATGTFMWRMYAEPLVLEYGGIRRTVFSERPGATYEIRVRQLANINFTYFMLDPPSTPLEMSGAFPIPPTSSMVLQVAMTNFNPPIPQLASLAGGGTTLSIPLTPTNFAKLSVTPNCVATSECWQVPIAQDEQFYGPQAQRGITVGILDLDGESQETVLYYAYQANAEIEYLFDLTGTNSMVTLTAPLDILLPVLG